VIRLLSLAALGLLLSACGYRLGGLYAIRDVRVEIFDNESERRTHEIDLSSAILQELVSRGIRVNHPQAPYTLKGRITDLRTPSLVDERNTDVILVGSLAFLVEIRLIGPDGSEVWRDRRSEAVSYTQARGETFETARQQVFDRLARWVLTHFEKDW
jgi:hypothetical protein